MDELVITPGKFIIMGDKNFHLDDTSDCNASRFRASIKSTGLIMHVREPTHRKGHTLVVIMWLTTSSISVRLKDRDYDVTAHIFLILSLTLTPNHNGSVKVCEVDIVVEECDVKMVGEECEVVRG